MVEKEMRRSMDDSQCVKLYRKRQAIVKAAEFRGPDNLQEILAWINENGGSAGPGNDGKSLFIETNEGTMRADLGDRIIRGVEDEFYPCKSQIFEMTYEIIEDGDDAEQ